MDPVVFVLVLSTWLVAVAAITSRIGTGSYYGGEQICFLDFEAQTIPHCQPGSTIVNRR